MHPWRFRFLPENVTQSVWPTLKPLQISKTLISCWPQNHVYFHPSIGANMWPSAACNNVAFIFVICYFWNGLIHIFFFCCTCFMLFFFCFLKKGIFGIFTHHLLLLKTRSATSFFMSLCCRSWFIFCQTLACCSSVCVSLYETITGSTDAEMPYHWYTDQRFSLFIVCLVIILPLSIPKEIGIQKYTR